MRKETVNQQNVQAALKYDKEFQPVIVGRSFVVNNNETGGKLARSTLVKYFA